MDRNIKITDKVTEEDFKEAVCDSDLVTGSFLEKDINKIIRKYHMDVLSDLRPFNSAYEAYACIQGYIDRAIYHNEYAMSNKDSLWSHIKCSMNTKHLNDKIIKDTIHMRQELEESVKNLLYVLMLCDRLIAWCGDLKEYEDEYYELYLEMQRM